MLWVLLWLLLAVSAVAVLTVLGIRLFRQAKALTRELSAASERLTALTSALDEQTGSAGTHVPDRR